MIVNLGGTSDLLKSAIPHDHNRVGHVDGLLLVVGDIDKGDAQLFLQPFQLMLHLAAKLQVQSAQRFIEKQDLRVVDEGSCDGHTLFLSAAHFGGHSFLKACKLYQLQHLADALFDLRLSHLLDLQTVTDVICHIHMGKQGIILKNRIDVPLLGTVVFHVFSLKEHLSFIRSFKACNDTERRGLAAA